MSWYDDQKNIEEYIRLADGYDGKELIEILRRYLSEGSTVLELGMGPGKDLDLLGKYYQATGSDNSELFIRGYLASNPGADVILLDAVTLATERRFNAVYSNKVMHHLSYEKMRASFERQAKLLEPGGFLLHSFWYGEEVENVGGLMFYQLTEKSLESILPDCVKICELKRYTEMEEQDSLYGVFTLTGN